ncbi:hypothetical protein FQZ97_1157090 [compost metagenome]
MNGLRLGRQGQRRTLGIRARAFARLTRHGMPRQQALEAPEQAPLGVTLAPPGLE